MQNNNHNKKNNSLKITRLYLVLIVVSIIIMISAAFITYGENPREIHVSLDKVIEKEEVQQKTTGAKIAIGGTDLSKVPDDETVKNILNDVIPNVCNECDEDHPIECLEEYKINKILVQDPARKDHLFIELLTGKKHKTVFKVTIDLNDDNKVIDSGGEIDDDVCIDTEIDAIDGIDTTSKYTSIERKGY